MSDSANTDKTLTGRWDAALMGNYGTPSLEIVSGSGTRLTDSAGTTYTDLFSGIAVNSLGHAHPAIVGAVTEQVATLGHVSNIYIHPKTVELAERLGAALDVEAPVRAMFCNSGTEANEAAFKIARLTGRSRILAAERGFHGRTMGALSITGQPDKREPFEPMPAGAEFFPYGDIDGLRTVVESGDPRDVAAIVLEPIQGEAGVHTPPEGYLADVRALCDEYGIFLVCDEVQTGIGRTGAMFASRHAGIVPDVITLAKGLGGGLPIGAVLGIGAAGELLRPGQHGSTFGGNPIAAAAALAVLDTIAAEHLDYHAYRLGRLMTADIEMLDHPLVTEVRGRGLLIGIALAEPVAAQIVEAARDAGFIVGTAGASVVRIAPPLIVSEDEIAAFLSALPGLLDGAASENTDTNDR